MSCDWVETLAVVDGIVDAPDGWLRVHKEHGVEKAREGVEYSWFVPAQDMKGDVIEMARDAFGEKLVHLIRMGIRPAILYDSTSRDLISQQQSDAIKRAVNALGQAGVMIVQRYLGERKKISLYMLTRADAFNLLTELYKEMKVREDGGRVQVRSVPATAKK